MDECKRRVREEEAARRRDDERQRNDCGVSLGSLCSADGAAGRIQ